MFSQVSVILFLGGGYAWSQVPSWGNGYVWSQAPRPGGGVYPGGRYTMMGMPEGLADIREGGGMYSHPPHQTWDLRYHLWY